MQLIVMLVILAGFLTTCSTLGCKTTANSVFLEDWEYIKTSPDYPDSYIIHVKNWERAQERLKELRTELDIEHTDSTDFTLFPSPSENYYIVKRKIWKRFLEEVERLKAKKKLKSLDTESLE